MTLDNVCDLFDDFIVYDKQSQLDDEYYASSSNIHSDGKFHKEVNKNGYLHIKSVEGATPDTMANYIMFLNQTGKIFLAIYKYCPEPLYKEIINNVNNLRKQLGMNRRKSETIAIPVNSNTNFSDVPGSELKTIESPAVTSGSVQADLSARLIDINTFRCENCEESILTYYKIDKTPDVLYCKCKSCNTLYKLLPSRYYILAEKNNTYKTGKGSISVKILEASNDKTTGKRVLNPKK